MKKPVSLSFAYLFCLLIGLAPATASAQLGSYVIQKGDCLWKIAAKPSIFHNPWKWPLLYQYNKKLISSPDRLEVGWQLQVPSALSAQEEADAIAFARAYNPSGQQVRALKPASQKARSQPAEEKQSTVASTQNQEAPAQQPTVENVGSTQPAPIPQASSHATLIMAGLILLASLLVGVIVWLRHSSEGFLTQSSPLANPTNPMKNEKPASAQPTPQPASVVAVIPTVENTTQPSPENTTSNLVPFPQAPAAQPVHSMENPAEPFKTLPPVEPPQQEHEDSSQQPSA